MRRSAEQRRIPVEDASGAGGNGWRIAMPVVETGIARRGRGNQYPGFCGYFGPATIPSICDCGIGRSAVRELDVRRAVRVVLLHAVDEVLRARGAPDRTSA